MPPPTSASGSLTFDAWAGENVDGEENEEVDGNEVGLLYAGIDLGTTNSCIALWRTDKNRVKVVRVDGDNRTMPSAVYWPRGTGSAPLVGREALRRATADGSCAITSAKRVIGLRCSDSELRALQTNLPFATGCNGATDAVTILVPLASDVKSSSPHAVAADCESGAIPAPPREENELNVEPAPHADGSVSPELVSSLVMAELKRRAEAYLQRKKWLPAAAPLLQACVVGVPVHFSRARRAATVAAARRAGFRRVEVIGESTAAAMAYGLHIAGTKTVLTFDLGGGTLDVSVMAVAEGRFQVRATAGDTHLGGDDFDGVVLRLAAAAAGIDLAALGGGEAAALRSACCAAKVALSDVDSVVVAHNILGPAAPRLQRAEFEAAAEPLVDSARATVLEALADAALSAGNVEEVVLVGGGSRMPCMRAMLSEVFPGRELCTAVDADLAVAEGAAIRGAVLNGVDRGTLLDALMLDVLPLAIGIAAETSGGGGNAAGGGGDDGGGKAADGTDGCSSGDRGHTFIEMLPRNSALPARASRSFALADPQQRGVTISIRERQPHVGSRKPTTATAAAGVAAEAAAEAANVPNAKAGAASRGDTSPVATFSFPLAHVDTSDVPESAPPRAVTVTLEVTADGAVKCAVADSWEEYAHGADTRRLLLLGGCVVALFVVYVWLRVRFADIDLFIT